MVQDESYILFDASHPYKNISFVLPVFSLLEMKFELAPRIILSVASSAKPSFFLIVSKKVYVVIELTFAIKFLPALETRESLCDAISHYL